eukprot:7378793-Heterocapsa_arctica.AAC.1
MAAEASSPRELGQAPTQRPEPDAELNQRGYHATQSPHNNPERGTEPDGSRPTGNAERSPEVINASPVD